MRILIFNGIQEKGDDIVTVLHVRWPEAEVLCVSNFHQGLIKLDKKDIDMVIINKGFTDIDNVTATLEIRKHSDVALIVIGSRIQDHKKLVQTLENGADEYIKPPFNQMELLARINAVLRQRRDIKNKSIKDYTK